MKGFDWGRYAPVGQDARQEAGLFGLGLVIAGLVSLQFAAAYHAARGRLFVQKLGRSVLREGALMPDFADLLGWSFAGFGVLLLGAVLTAALHAACHRQGGSRADYLMRRLPDRWEYPRRCLAVPAAAALAGLLAMGALLAVYYAVYMTCTPAACLTPDQWGKIWRLP